jgi:hypothetical protein
VTEDNWTWRVPVRVDEWQDSPEWVERARSLAAWTATSQRF